MKQILQHLDNGQTSLLDIPIPKASGPRLVVRAQTSVISAGTERMLVEFSRGGLIDKARSQPDKVKDVIAKVRTDGLMATYEAVQGKLGTPIPLGYCSAGIVEEVGSAVTRFKAGDRVVTNGPHAEYVSVPHTLAAKIPDNVSFEAAAFTPIASIGLQGIRLAEPTFGETVVVYGLGLIGLLCVQLLRANGCAVIGIDRSADRIALAKTFGATTIDGTDTDVAAQVIELTGGMGADAVLLTLASDSDQPIRDSARMARKRGRLVLVGVTGLNIVRDEFFKKELSFQVSCSYGPGRYDPQYEDRGIDYPAGYVRWTEQRNFEAVLGAMAAGQLDPTPLITHRFAFASAPSAYELVASNAPSIGIVLEYPAETAAPIDATRHRVDRVTARAAEGGRSTIGVIGAGNFATRMLIPLLRDAGARLRTIAAGSGPSAGIAGQQFGFERVTADVSDVFDDAAIDTVYVLTRHDSHANFVMRGLAAGKNVFVEKPLALTTAELDEIENARGGLLMVGFNRRFAPLAQEVRGLVARRAGPLAVNILVNAGAIPAEHWTQDPVIGGGRIVGEGCHFIDLARFLVGSPIASLELTSAGAKNGRSIDDVTAMVLSFEDGSIASIQYLANGAKSFPKERVDCFFDGKTLTIDNWRRLDRYGISGPFRPWGSKQDKGHREEIQRWMHAIERGDTAPIARDELIEIARWSIRAGSLARRHDTSASL